MPACRDCGHWLPTVSGLNKHIASSKACHQKWQDRLKNFSINVFDLGQGYSAGDEQEVDADEHHERDGGREDATYGEQDAPPTSPPSESPPIQRASADEVPDVEPEPNSHHQASVEEVPDEPERITEDTRWIEGYPAEHMAGAPCQDDVVPTKFHAIQEEQEVSGGSLWGSFHDEEEWELAKWLVQNVGQNQTDKFLKLPIVSSMLMLRTIH